METIKDPENAKTNSLFKFDEKEEEKDSFSSKISDNFSEKLTELFSQTK
jgi:hypothetical protein